MTRRHQRWAATVFIVLVGAGAVAAYHFGFAKQRMLMFGWFAPLFVIGYAVGINVWTGGPFDWNNDRAIEERNAGR